MLKAFAINFGTSSVLIGLTALFFRHWRCIGSKQLHLVLTGLDNYQPTGNFRRSPGSDCGDSGHAGAAEPHLHPSPEIVSRAERGRYSSALRFRVIVYVLIRHLPSRILYGKGWEGSQNDEGTLRRDL